MKTATSILAAGAAAVSTLALAASGPLPPKPPPGAGLSGDQCVPTDDFRNHRIADARTLLVEVWGKGVYRFNMASDCMRGAVSSDRLSIGTVGGGRVCSPGKIDIGVRGGRCVVESIDRLTAEQAAALPRGLRP